MRRATRKVRKQDKAPRDSSSGLYSPDQSNHADASNNNNTVILAFRWLDDVDDMALGWLIQWKLWFTSNIGLGRAKYHLAGPKTQYESGISSGYSIKFDILYLSAGSAGLFIIPEFKSSPNSLPGIDYVKSLRIPMINWINQAA